MYHNAMKTINDKPVANTLQPKVERFSKIKNKARTPTPAFLLNMVLQILPGAVTHPNGKGRSYTAFLPMQQDLTYRKTYTLHEKTIRLTNSVRLQDTNLTYKNPRSPLNVYNKLPKKEIKNKTKSSPFAISPKSLTTEVKSLYIRNYKTFRRVWLAHPYSTPEGQSSISSSGS